MSLADISIRRPVMAWMVMSALVFFGGLAFYNLGVSQMPDVDFPTVSVSASYAGAAPEIIETDVVDILENAVMGIEGVRNVASSCRAGSARISVEFDLNRDINAAFQEVQTKVAQAQRQLPKNVDPPIITKSNADDSPIMWLTVTSKTKAPGEIMTYVRDTLKDRFTNINGVGDVLLGGYVDPALRVWVNKRALNTWELTVQDVLNAIQNEHIELPGGAITGRRNEFPIRTMGEARSLEEFGRISINARGGQPITVPVYLNSVAKIETGLADVQRLSRADGKAAIGLGILKQRGSNAVEIGKAVRERVRELQRELPPGIELGVRIDSTRFIEEAMRELMITLCISVALTSLVVWIFLGSFSGTFNVLLSIPTSIMGSFILLFLLHFTLNTFTLMALSLAVGIVVDDAIIVLENIIRHVQRGKNRVEASREGTREISFAAMAGTIAIIALFLPVAFMSGIVGKFFFQFAVTICIAVGLSLFEALTLTPMRCSQFIDAREHTSWFGRGFNRGFEGLRTGYARLLTQALNHRALVLLGAAALFCSSLGMLKLLPSELIPAQDQSMFMIRLKSPAGASLAYTDSKVKAVEKILLQRPEVAGYFSNVGGFGGNDPTSGGVSVSLKPRGERGHGKGRSDISQQALMGQLRKQLKKSIRGCKVTIMDPSLRSFSTGGAWNVELTVRGADWELLGSVSQKLYAAMEAMPTLQDVSTDYLLGNTEFEIIPDRIKASAYGVSLTAIAQTINALIGGAKAGQFQNDVHRFDILVKLPDSDRSEKSLLNGIQVRNNRGELIPLSRVVRVTKRPALQTINRINRERAIGISANVKPGASQATAIAEIEARARQLLPPGYRIVLEGNAKASRESMQSLMMVLVVGLLVAYMVLASQFNSYKHPFTVLMALPFSVTGALIALYVTGQSLNIYSMIGIILLMGLVKKNSILLVDFTNQLRSQGKGVTEALIHACPIRFRPIIMTTCATIAGAVPPALAMGPGAETRIPMAVAVIGGLIISTLMTLFVVPCFYSLIASKRDFEMPQ